jgi:hypothetical protein
VEIVKKKETGREYLCRRSLRPSVRTSREDQQHKAEVWADLLYQHKEDHLVKAARVTVVPAEAVALDKGAAVIGQEVPGGLSAELLEVLSNKRLTLKRFRIKFVRRRLSLPEIPGTRISRQSTVVTNGKRWLRKEPRRKILMEM